MLKVVANLILELLNVYSLVIHQQEGVQILLPSKLSDLVPFHPTKFIWKSKVLLKVKAFVWIVAHKKVNTNDMLQLRRPSKALSPDWCILCKGEWRDERPPISTLSVHFGFVASTFYIGRDDVGLA